MKKMLYHVKILRIYYRTIFFGEKCKRRKYRFDRRHLYDRKYLRRGGESAEKGRSRKCILFDGKYWTRNLIFVILKVMHIRIKRMR